MDTGNGMAQGAYIETKVATSDGTENKKSVATDSLFPWRINYIDDNLPGWLGDAAKIENALGFLGIQVVIDEVALLFRNDELVEHFVMDMVQTDGVELFNTATDEVTTRPIFSQYVVNYAFLRLPGNKMRLECMNIVDGLSPLHEAHGQMNELHWGVPIPVHYSFKCDPNDYNEVLGELEKVMGAPLMRCASRYGEFAYFKMPDVNDFMYIKPRVNLRDSVGDGMPTLGSTMRDF